MTLENMFQSIIVDDYMYKVNNAIQRVYGVKPIGSVFSDEELIHFTNYWYMRHHLHKFRVRGQQCDFCKSSISTYSLATRQSI